MPNLTTLTGASWSARMTLNVVLHLDAQFSRQLEEVVALLKRDRITPEERRILTAALRQLQSKTSDVNRALQNQTGEEA